MVATVVRCAFALLAIIVQATGFQIVPKRYSLCFPPSSMSRQVFPRFSLVSLTRNSPPTDTRSNTELAMGSNEDTHQGHRKSLEEELSNHLATMTSASSTVDEKVVALRNISLRKFRGSKQLVNIAEIIHNHFQAIVEDIKVALLPEIVWSLGFCGFSVSTSRYAPFLERLIQRTAKAAPQLTHPMLIKCFLGLGSLGFQSSSAGTSSSSSSQRLTGSLTAIVDALLAQHSQLSLTSTTNVVHGCYVMRIRWKDLSPRSQAHLAALIQRTATTLQPLPSGHSDALNAPQLFFHLSTMGLTKSQAVAVGIDAALLVIAEQALWSLTQPKQAATLAAAVPGTATAIATATTTTTSRDDKTLLQVPQLAANTVYGLGKVGFVYKALPETMRTQLHAALETTLLQMSPRELSATCYGLGLLNTPWSVLPTTVRKALLQRSIETAPSANAQALTNILYGLCLMQAPLSIFPTSFKDAVHAQIVALFTQRKHFSRANKQSLSNVLYSLANTGYQWSDIPPSTRAALLQGINTYAEYFIPQELSVTVSSLGMLRAPFETVFPVVEASLTAAFVRLERELYTLHSICTLLSGLARMGAHWEKLPTAIQDVAWRIIAAGRNPTDVSVPCILHAFGQLDLHWATLPLSIQRHLMSLSAGLVLREQSLANTIFGLGMMEATWEMLDAPLTTTLVSALQDPASLAECYPQHLSNVVWGLSRLAIPRSVVPWTMLLTPIVTAAPRMSMKELAQVIYGLGTLEFAWTEVPLEVVEALADAIGAYAQSFTSQDIANMMYAVTLMCYDVNFAVLDAAPRQEDAATAYRYAHAAATVMEALLAKYHAHAQDWGAAYQQHDQYQIFLLWLEAVTARCSTLKTQLTRFWPTATQAVTGPSATVPSITHGRICHGLQHRLRYISPGFTLFNEFLGFTGVFPMDMAVYHDEVLVAFIEVDGAFHYRTCPETGTVTLRRIDRLKESLYRQRFPEIPTIRIAASQSPFQVVTRSMAAVLLGEFDPRVGRWRREGKTVIIRDRVSIASSAEAVDDGGKDTDGGGDDRGDEAEEDGSWAENEAEAIGGVGSGGGGGGSGGGIGSGGVGGSGESAALADVGRHMDMDVVVRRLRPVGTAFVEEIVPYAMEWQRMVESDEHAEPSASISSNITATATPTATSASESPVLTLVGGAKNTRLSGSKTKSIDHVFSSKTAVCLVDNEEGNGDAASSSIVAALEPRPCTPPSAVGVAVVPVRRRGRPPKN